MLFIWQNSNLNQWRREFNLGIIGVGMFEVKHPSDYPKYKIILCTYLSIFLNYCWENYGAEYQSTTNCKEAKSTLGIYLI